MHRVHATLIAAHAVTATVALVTAFGGRRARWFAVYYGTMGAMLVTLVGAIAVDLVGRNATQHLISGGLVILGGYMVWRAELARRTRRDDPRAFVSHAGFTVVGLIDAFVVVTVFNAGVPGWLAAAIGAVIAVAGHVVIGALRNGTPQSAARAGATRQ